ncbi:MAG TPA: prolipoprotein diacylglyceryl transferase [Polyangiaceae bacterium]|nr:prolipoprotein diacylglyceryl transferase [Polyangiaceae bacterium]
MQNRLFTLFDIPFPSYFFLLLAGVLFCTAIGTLWAKRVGQDPDVIVDLGLMGLLVGVIGARVMHVLVDGYFWDYVHLCSNPSLVEWKITRAECLRDQYAEGWLFGIGSHPHGPLGNWDAVKEVCRPVVPATLSGRIDLCMSWAKFWAGGLTYYGGFIGGTAAAWYLLRRDRFPFWKAADMAAIAIPVGIGFGRMGCLLAGCCFGKPHGGHLGLVFPPRSPASEFQHRIGLIDSPFQASLSVHPTQIYESAAAFTISAICALYVHGRKRYDGQVFFSFLGLYAFARFMLEFLRSDDRGGVLGLSTSQWIGLGMLGVAFAAHRWFAARAENRPTPPVALKSA